MGILPIIQQGSHPMKSRFALIAGVALLAACSQGAKQEEAPAGGASAAAGAADTTTRVADGVTGVPECDDYLNKVMACIKDKVPEAQRAAMEDAINKSKSQWAAIPDKTALAQQCKSALDQAKTSYSAMGCQF